MTTIQYRTLQPGEIIREGDEEAMVDGSWLSVLPEWAGRTVGPTWGDYYRRPIPCADPQTPGEWEEAGPDSSWICFHDAAPAAAVEFETLSKGENGLWTHVPRSDCVEQPPTDLDLTDTMEATIAYWRPLAHTLTDEAGWEVSP